MRRTPPRMRRTARLCVVTNMPAWVADKQRRLVRIKEAKAALEAKAAAEAKAKAKASPKAKARKPASRTPEVAAPKPPDKAQRNFTDPESRILKTKNGYIQGYNAQAAADAGHQVIVAHGLAGSGIDQDQLAPMIEAIEAAAGRLPDELSDDAGYCSEKNLKTLEGRAIRGYLATGRQKHGANGGGGRQGRAAGEPARGHGAAPETGWTAQPLPAAQDHHRAGVRPHQAGPGLPAVPAARPRPGVS